MLLTGTPIDAATALDWGLVNRVVPDEHLDTEVDELARAILAHSAPVIANGKRTFYAQIDQPLDTAYAVAADAMVRDLSALDAAEGIDAFLEKRTARWPSTSGGD
jgi:enoyl-CoA hydratase/carnithine racemase